jgi:hypothetical protein
MAGKTSTKINSTWEYRLFMPAQSVMEMPKDSPLILLFDNLIKNGRQKNERKDMYSFVTGEDLNELPSGIGVKRRGICEGKLEIKLRVAIATGKHLNGLEKWEKYVQTVASDADITAFLQACGAVDKTKKNPTNIEHGTKVIVSKKRSQAKFGSCEIVLDRLIVTSVGKEEQHWISLSVESNKLNQVKFDLNACKNKINLLQIVKNVEKLNPNIPIVYGGYASFIQYYLQVHRKNTYSYGPNSVIV